MGRRFATGVIAGLALLGIGGCSDDGGDDAAATEDPTTTASEASTTSAAPTTEEPTTTMSEELDIPTIQAFMEEEHPDEAALVDWTLFSWISIRGYTAPIPTGATREQGVAVCDALAEIVDQYAEDDPIHIVIGPEQAPWAYRAGPDGTCA